MGQLHGAYLIGGGYPAGTNSQAFRNLSRLEANVKALFSGAMSETLQILLVLQGCDHNGSTEYNEHFGLCIHILVAEGGHH